MTIHLLFFGALTDIVGEKQQVLKTDERLTIENINANLKLKFPALINHTYKIALNKILAEPSTTVNDGDEVAFLPPFAGG